MKKKTLVLIDSNALVHRAFHALPPLSTKDGTPSGAVYGVALTVLGVLEKFKPDYIAATFDLKGPTFRHKKFKEYKGKRKKAPDELYAQIPIAKELMRAFGIPVYEKAGFEADDVIGTVAKDKANLNGNIERIIVTGDMDTLQLVDKDVKVFTLRRGIKDTFLYDEQQVRNRFKLNPDQIVDYKALRGDPSDNIPGIAGVGEKTATDLLIEFGTLDGIYENVNKIKSPAIKKKIEEGKEDAYLSQDLARIRTNVPIEFDLEKCVADEHKDRKELVDFFSKMGFSSLIRRISGDRQKTIDKRQQEKFKDIKIQSIDSSEDLRNLIEQIKKEKRFSFWPLADTDKSFGVRVEGLGVCLDTDKSFFVPVEYVGEIKKIFQDKKIEKIGFNVKHAMQLLEIFEDDNWQDVQIISYLLGQNATNFEKLILKEFDAQLKHAVAKSGQGSLLANTDVERQKDVAERAVWTMRLHDVCVQRLGKGLLRVYEELELPLIPILSKMEAVGVKVDKSKLKEVSDLAEKKIKKLESEIYKLAGKQFNINSPFQVAPVLYDDLKISTTGIKRGKTGFSTDADQLRKIMELHPIVPLIEQYREFFKIKSTYADALPNLIEKDGRIHAHFNQAVAATGRLSSSDPNLQNIPKRGKLANTIREAFVAGKGKVLVSADYSQIDLRVAAHLSSDSKMIETFKKGKDIHAATAAWVNKVPESKIDEKTRNEAKSLNFGILYGMGLYGFMRDSGVSMERAKFFMDHYKETFSGLMEFIEHTKETAREKGYVETQMGRRRYIPNIKASNAMMRNAAERVAVNLPVQGLAADIMKLSMIHVEQRVMKKYEAKAELILQIHDELIFEVDKKEADEFARQVKKTMENVYELKVPLIVDVSAGKNWKEL